MFLSGEKPVSDIQFLGDSQRSSALNSISDRQAEARKPPQPAEIKESLFEKPVYFSPRIAIDRETANAVLQVRDTETGDILRQYPPDSAAQIYQSIQDTAASDAIPEAQIVQEAEAALAGETEFGDSAEAAPEQFGAAPAATAAAPKPNVPETTPAPTEAAAPTPPSASLSATSQASSGLTGRSGQEEQRPLDTSV